MLDHRLFLGLPLTESFLQQFRQIPQPLKEAFIQDQSPDYLQQIENEGVTYLGKYIDTPYEMSALESLQTHVYSLLQRVIPDFPYADQPLFLLALPPSHDERK